MNTLEKTGRGPVYLKISDVLRDRILAREYEPGGFLPPEDTLAESFSVSVGTMKRALSKLTEDGLIERTRGRGTQVLDPKSAVSRKLILVLLGEVKRSFFAEVFRGIQEGMRGQGYQTILHDNSNSSDVERRILEEYGDSIAGAIFAPFSASDNVVGYARLLEKGVPLVFVDRYVPLLNVDAVVCDDVRGGYLATRHLIESGHRRIAAVCRRRATSIHNRILGYRQALSEAGIPFDESLIYAAPEGNAGDEAYDDAYELTGTLLNDHPEVTAIFGMRDDMAWGCMQRLFDMGRNVPKDVSVVGFGDEDDVCMRLRPRLTTVRQDKRDMGVKVAELLLKRMKAIEKTGNRGDDPKGLLGEEAVNPGIVTLPVELIMRDSTSRASEKRKHIRPTVQVSRAV